VSRPIEPADRDRRRATRDRRRTVHDRRHFWPRLATSGVWGAVVRWFTGPWTSANGLSWMRLLVIFLVIRWAFLTVYSIPSESMEPTLLGDENFLARDRVAVNKWAFGPRIPFSTTRILPTGSPKRWDIVVFDSPAPNQEGDILIKRVVGLPGERVRLNNGGLLIDGEPMQPPEEIASNLHYLGQHDISVETIGRLIAGFARTRRIPVDLPREPKQAFTDLRIDLDALHAEVTSMGSDRIPRLVAQRLARSVREPGRDLVKQWWMRQLKASNPIQYGVATGKEFSVVPEGHYFCLGDNGPESVDSRMFGWVPKENLIGNAFAIVTPPGRARDLTGFSQTPRGHLILYGSIALVFAWEVIPGFIVFSMKLRGPIRQVGLRRGERILVDRLTYGLRIPFFQRRFVWWRRPRVGEIICYRMSRTRAQDLYVGEIRQIESGRKVRVFVTGPEDTDGSERLYALAGKDIAGIARVVWWPARRRRRIHSAAERVESPPAVHID
jgi:signal peptidase I